MNVIETSEAIIRSRPNRTTTSRELKSAASYPCRLATCQCDTSLPSHIMSQRLFCVSFLLITITGIAEGNDSSVVNLLENAGVTIVRDEAEQDRPISSIIVPLASVTPECVGAIKDLEELPAIELVGTGNSDVPLNLLQALQKKPSLKRLTISFAKISDESAARIGALQQLQSLQLQRRIEASPTAVDSMLRLTGLKELTLSGRMVEDETLQRVSKMPVLRKLGLESAFITDGGIQILRRLRNLRSLTIYLGDRVSNQGIDQIADMSLSDIHITLLTASNDRVKALRKISGLKDLKFVSANNVDDAAIPHLAELTELETLILSDARFSHAGVKELRTSLPKCQIEIDNRPRN